MWEAGFPRSVQVIEHLRVWQATLVNEIRGPIPDRKIIWYCDFNGGQGKSALTKYLGVNKLGFFVRGAAADIFCAIATAVENCQEDNTEIRCVVVDIPRASQSRVSYSAIEEIKNGMIFFWQV